MKCAFDGCNRNVEPRAGNKPHVGRQPKYCIAHRGTTNVRYNAARAMAIADGIIPADTYLRFDNPQDQPDPKLRTSKQRDDKPFNTRNSVADILIDWGEGRRTKAEAYRLLKQKIKVD